MKNLISEYNIEENVLEQLDSDDEWFEVSISKNESFISINKCRQAHEYYDLFFKGSSLSLMNHVILSLNQVMILKN